MYRDENVPVLFYFVDEYVLLIVILLLVIQLEVKDGKYNFKLTSIKKYDYL